MRGLLEIDAETFSANFGRRSFMIRHRLVGHPLLEAAAIAELADRLPPDAVRRERGDLPLENRGYVDIGAGAPSETILSIAENGCRVSLREIQDDEIYASLIAESHADIDLHVRVREGGIVRRSAYVFVTAPGSTTPMHLDPEHSFLLQIHGSKRVCSAPLSADARQRELERYFDGKPCAFDAMVAECDEFTLAPGDGLYLPSFVPHWVEQTGEGSSVSFSLPFYTRYCERADRVNRVNKRLRRLHLSPRPAGASASIDWVKASLLRSWTMLRTTRVR